MDVKKEDIVVVRKPVYFFEKVSSTVFIALIGIFSTLFLIFFSFSVLFLNPLHIQFSLFTSIGAVFFIASYRLFLKSHSSCLRNLNYEAFLTSRNKLFFWVLWSLNFYLLICWFLLILLGATGGFNFKSPTGDRSDSLIITDAYTTKITGLVLLLVHLFFLLLVKTITYYWGKIFEFARTEFEKRRKNLEIVRTKANLDN